MTIDRVCVCVCVCVSVCVLKSQHIKNTEKKKVKYLTQHLTITSSIPLSLHPSPSNYKHVIRERGERGEERAMEEEGEEGRKR